MFEVWIQNFLSFPVIEQEMKGSSKRAISAFLAVS